MARKLRSAIKRKAVEPVESSSGESAHEPEIEQKDASVKAVELDRVNGEIHFSSEFINEMEEMEVSNTHFYGEWAHDIRSTGQDDSVSVKFTVAILLSESLIEKMGNFDEQKKDVSDATLILNGQHFYVSKFYLATHSTIFKPMFVGDLADKHINVTIKDIDPTDMQTYLEVLYGYRDIEENTVEGLILLGKRLQTDIILNKSQKFLMDKSVKELKKKFELSTKYELDDLITWCFSNMKTLQDVKMCIPEEDLTRRLNSLAPEIITKLLQKVLLLHRLCI
ncbi:hypothetical protein CAEBREN_14171 [Caenorhabditis brenneri]|uniref:BTB domain-containing protein n=1 Tax=Caenorhabditis brenneri TaxID=135651 RepID=G0MXA3_CAEBE|nr:hypothetical protein CAEBREN_14171 [Caenorhabditis brenneri]